MINFPILYSFSLLPINIVPVVHSFTLLELKNFPFYLDKKEECWRIFDHTMNPEFAFVLIKENLPWIRRLSLKLADIN